MVSSALLYLLFFGCGCSVALNYFEMSSRIDAVLIFYESGVNAWQYTWTPADEAKKIEGVLRDDDEKELGASLHLISQADTHLDYPTMILKGLENANNSNVIAIKSLSSSEGRVNATEWKFAKTDWEDFAVEVAAASLIILNPNEFQLNVRADSNLVVHIERKDDNLFDWAKSKSTVFCKEQDNPCLSLANRILFQVDVRGCVYIAHSCPDPFVIEWSNQLLENGLSQRRGQYNWTVQFASGDQYSLLETSKFALMENKLFFDFGLFAFGYLSGAVIGILLTVRCRRAPTKTPEDANADVDGLARYAADPTSTEYNYTSLLVKHSSLRKKAKTPPDTIPRRGLPDSNARPALFKSYSSRAEMVARRCATFKNTMAERPGPCNYPLAPPTEVYDYTCGYGYAYEYAYDPYPLYCDVQAFDYQNAADAAATSRAADEAAYAEYTGGEGAGQGKAEFGVGVEPGHEAEHDMMVPYSIPIDVDVDVDPLYSYTHAAQHQLGRLVEHQAYLPSSFDGAY